MCLDNLRLFSEAPPSLLMTVSSFTPINFSLPCLLASREGKIRARELVLEVGGSLSSPDIQGASENMLGNQRPVGIQQGLRLPSLSQRRFSYPL